MTKKNLNDAKRPCVYFITDGEYVKIGVSDNIMKRLRELQTANAKLLRILDIIPTDNPYNLEQQLHQKYADYHMVNEWFDILHLFVKKDHILLDPDEVEAYFRLRHGTARDKIAYRYAMIGTYYDRVSQVTKEEYEKYLMIYHYIDESMKI